MTLKAPRLELASELRGRLLAGQVWAWPVAVGDIGPALQEEIDSWCSELRGTHAGRSPAEIEGLQPARELYRLFGIDPTKLRPSSEALLRRVLKRRPLPRISNAVDLGNYVALRLLLPLGLYDADRIEGQVLFRPGGAAEAYTGVRKDEVHLEGRPVLADDRGPFGNPTADSLRTAVRRSTTRLWMVVFAPVSYGRDRLDAELSFVREAMARHLAPPDRTVETGSGVTS